MKNKRNLLFTVLIFLTIIGSQCGKPKEITYDYSYKVVYEQSGAKSWIFEGKYPPPFDLNNQSNFKRDVNNVLRLIELPEINSAVLEKSNYTGYRFHRRIYEWTDYPLGVLSVSRTLRSDINYEKYDAIWKVTLAVK